mmetsp:Transcript_20725/g.27290  ORF Transcript_20725/g.27290 Transcript_20725/m.27290 type:complete len:322 (+) Transcript_20725:97-1062(+)|eukprot:CAMPEP_0117752922 /NCGR_PEP_ID=MMETSP0947-20121206/11911_1 /TAXON_ID=44440 /ORGANISM="Chattonella subsalsa, Strain CCMP2191" /LENGTH=321 /DNA_ID=CAMNT_0005571691 /DNA_START=95 /DNA_END=1060 /DNA_ORIENTATION=-
MEPEHLIILAHGINGSPKDLGYLEHQLRVGLSTRTLVVCSKSNFSRTKDGLVAGGNRLVEEIRSYAEAHPSLRQLSLIGNSLGGIYVRYAIGHLDFDAKSQTFLGRLEPLIFMTIASPHLGMRTFTYYPTFLHRFVRVLYGKTGEDLILRDAVSSQDESHSRFLDGMPLLVRMATSEQYLVPLRSFSHRRLYANISKDLAVPCGTAAFQPNFRGGRQIEFLNGPSQQSRVQVFESIIPQTGMHEDASVVENHSTPYEQIMARNLDKCGWHKVGIQFSGCIGDAHNRICAWSRHKLGEWYFKSGRVVMDDAVRAFQTKSSSS